MKHVLTTAPLPTVSAGPHRGELVGYTVLDPRLIRWRFKVFTAGSKGRVETEIPLDTGTCITTSKALREVLSIGNFLVRPTEAEARAFDLDALVGLPCRVNVELTGEGSLPTIASVRGGSS